MPHFLMFPSMWAKAELFSISLFSKQVPFQSFPRIEYIDSFLKKLIVTSESAFSFFPFSGLSRHTCSLNSVDNRKWNTVSYYCPLRQNLYILNKITLLILGRNIIPNIVLPNEQVFLYRFSKRYTSRDSKGAVRHKKMYSSSFWSVKSVLRMVKLLLKNL